MEQSRPLPFYSGVFWITPAILLFGTLTALLGGATVVQWLRHETFLLHIGPGNPILVLHFNSALCFFLGGLALIAFGIEWRRLALVLGGVTFALSGATLVEYFANVDLGIDQAVVRAYITSNFAHPGRMSEITSTNWFLLSLVIFIEALARPGGWRFVATCFLSSLVLANNGMALVGYWIGLPDSYTWGIFHRVTLQTAVCFCCLGFGFVLHTLRNVPMGGRKDARGLPLAAGLGVFTASLILWQVLLAGNRWQVLNDMDAVRTTLGAQMIEQIDSRVRALERMGKRVEVRPGGMTFGEWQTDALFYIEHERVFRGIARTRADGHVMWWVHDESGLEPKPGGTLGDPVFQKEAMDRAEGGGGTVASRIDQIGDATSGSRPIEGFVTWFPIYKNGRLDGFIAGCFDARQLLARIDVGNGLGKFSFRVREGDHVLYSRGDFDQEPYRQTFPLDYLNLGWQIDIEPGPLLLARENSHLAYLILILGLLFSGALSMAVSSYQKARRQTRAVRAIETILRESEERYRLLVSNVQDYAIYPLGPDGRIAGWNTGAERLHGYKADEVLGQDVYFFYPPDEIPRDRPDPIRTAREEGRNAEEGWRIRKDGTRFWANVTITALRNEAGEIFGFSKITRDLTKQKETTALLAQRNAALEIAMARVEEVSRLKSEFLSNMSHELRTPLNSVIGFSEFLRDQKPGPLNADQREYLDDVLKSAHYLLQLINDLLDLAKIEAGRMELLLESFSLRAHAEEVVSQMRPLLEKKGLHFVSRLEVETVVLDPKKIRQILNNLLSNAIKFTHAEGKIELAIVPAGENQIEIIVRDTGIGIKEEDFDRLFGEFQQLDSGVSRRYQGSGLGLALTKKLVTLHGGAIRVESVFSMGSTFIVTLPKHAVTSPSS
ncbi:PAS domain S-box-containing protein [Verrucomicrobium sp. GAS474]|uniref:sensor histidine kinase n=1 Tax=Verrucomicrobium sp. GAS474 TaxID=1882831 RepID=UPI00087D4396|nr:ATP-binding protein [Verrucomicrobium sp. GAS474]SDT97071.1 PAS domain S-box-containing protein [Verrucomicrobium sp. GAS474]